MGENGDGAGSGRLSAGDEGDEFLTGGRARATSGDGDARSHDPDLIREAHDLVEVVADQQDRDPGFLEFGDRGLDAGRLLNAEAAVGSSMMTMWLP